MTLPEDCRDIRREGRVLFALLQALAEENLLAGSAGEDAWGGIVRRIQDHAHHEAEAEACYELLLLLEQEGRLGAPWVQSRWRAVRERIEEPDSPADGAPPE